MKYDFGDKVKHMKFGIGEVKEIFPGKKETLYLVDWTNLPYTNKVKERNLDLVREEE